MFRIIVGAVIGYLLSLGSSVVWFLKTHHDPTQRVSTRYLLASIVVGFFCSVATGFLAAVIGGSRRSAWGRTPRRWWRRRSAHHVRFRPFGRGGVSPGQPVGFFGAHLGLDRRYGPGNGFRRRVGGTATGTREKVVYFHWFTVWSEFLLKLSVFTSHFMNRLCYGMRQMF